MLENLKNRVCAANLDLVDKGVVIYTWGNVSGISDDRKYMVIKPSGMDLKTLMLNPNAEMKQYVLDKHYMRKHGPNAYYGQI